MNVLVSEEFKDKSLQSIDAFAVKDDLIEVKEVKIVPHVEGKRLRKNQVMSIAYSDNTITPNFEIAHGQI